MRCSYSVLLISGALWTSTDAAASNWPSVRREKRRDELHRAAPSHRVVDSAVDSAVNTSLLCVPLVKNARELKAATSGSCVECDVAKNGSWNVMAP